jgi:pimeloyl-ACP methyl ester carboxylesterase
VAADLPCDDDSAGLAEYADTVLDAIGDRRELILVAQSLAGFTAPLVCDRIKVDLLVLLVAMIPRPGEPPGEWWSNTGWQPARRAQAERDGRSVNGEFDPMVEFLHDVPADVMVDVLAHGPPREQSGTPFEKPWPLAEWPDVPTEVLICRDDRFFPAEFMRRVARERLGITPDEMAGGHLPALSRADDLAARLETYRVEHGL